MTKRNFYGWHRINKTAARKAFNAGNNVLFVPCNMQIKLDCYCNYHVVLNNNIVEFTGITKPDFDTLCNHFEYYNCNNETGKYTAFYIWEN